MRKSRIPTLGGLYPSTTMQKYLQAPILSYCKNRFFNASQIFLFKIELETSFVSEIGYN